MSLPDDELFFAALQIPSTEQQGQWVRMKCKDDPEQAQRVLQLLTVHHQIQPSATTTPSLLDRPEEVFQSFSIVKHSESGTQIGPYLLGPQIGEGGMGIVYQARQREPIERDVALKLLKPGMDSQRILARFALERQVLEQLSHPGITKILDAGVQQNGRPFFVMELVPQAKTITEYCQLYDLALEPRLSLMIEVCKIIQHAHQRGIIHRDLKPSNILLSDNQDGLHNPKVIDFGIAKVIHPSQFAAENLTIAGERFGTPAYMSPEQARSQNHLVDIRSDIYSLGVILYELLTGRTPEDTVDTNWTRPLVLPSQAIQNHAKSDSQNHSLHINLWRKLTNELDWIAWKALAPSPDERYQTVADFQRDLEAYLAGQTVAAVKPSLRYRFTKMVSRNRVASAAIAFGLITILITSVAIASFAYRASIAEAEAKQSLRNVLAMQSELTNERDKANQARVQAESLLRIFQVQTASSLALSQYVSQAIETAPRDLQGNAIRPTIAADEFQIAWLTTPHQRLIAQGDWSWSTKQFPTEVLNAAIRVDSQQAAATHSLAIGNSRSAQPIPPDINSRISYQSLLLQQLRALLPESDPFIAEVLDNCGLLAIDVGDYEKAIRLLCEASNAWKQIQSYPLRELQSKLFLTDAFLAVHQAEQAASTLREAERLLQQIPSASPERAQLQTFFQKLQQRLR